MSGHFPQADYQHFGFSAQMIEHLRWLTCAATAATGAQNGDFAMFGDQEPLGQSFDYQPPTESDVGFTDATPDYTARSTAADAFGQSVGFGDPAAIFAAISRLSDDVQGLCAIVDERDQEINVLRDKIRDLECLSV